MNYIMLLYEFKNTAVDLSSLFIGIFKVIKLQSVFLIMKKRIILNQ